MSMSDPPDCLAYHLSRPLTQARSLATMACATAAAGVKQFMASDTEASTKPETSALQFYLLNHAAALIRKQRGPHEPLPEIEQRLVQRYYARNSLAAIRASYYLLLICTRESRHLTNPGVLHPKLGKELGPEVVAFNAKIKGTGSEVAYQTFLNQPPACPLGVYARALQYIFYQGKFNSGYGGPAWGKVADCLVNFVLGLYSPEMMLDTIWTLCHNNGPIFNKGMLYAGYASAQGVQKLLDVQRSGQVPELVLHDNWAKPFLTPELKVAANDIRTAFPGQIGGFVDWYKVEALGAVGKYPNEKKQQIANQQIDPAALKAQADQAAAMAAADLQAAQAAQAAAHAAEQQKWFHVMPGLKLEKVKPKRSVAA